MDDDESIAELYKRALRKAGYDVRHAPNGRAALDEVEATVPALIICDVMMPYMDGFSFLKRLRTDRRFALTPVLLMTALNGEQDRADGFRYGADEYLVKPVKPAQLLEAVQGVLARTQRPRLLANGPPFGGDLHTLGLAAILMALAAEKRSGVLQLESMGVRGEAVIRDGVPIAASAAGSDGAMAALVAMLGWRAGSFEFQPGDPSGVQDVLRMPLDRLLSEAEAARAGG